MERPPVTPEVMERQASFHADIVQEVAEAVRTEPVVVVGMSVNPHVKRARGALDKAGIAYRYIEHGGYHNRWKERLALKIWAGWPTFPQVFVKGTLVGGADQTEAMLASGDLQKLLEG
ncbi:MAG: glutaredoxin [Alphaproteobacteria bacterium]|nr:glutaredoxin [Alphaproteobacteria bacterium]